ncbi:hypothetical protein K7432_008750 [Basidiobolus ranarum]|uniref:O-fucosyltransferase family protein n=1 Tax=Basidiobolus ranarum TaxID=34480 RepID=A0ABR2WRJ9_9FUNG
MMYRIITKSISTICCWRAYFSNIFISHKWTLLDSQDKRYSKKSRYSCLSMVICFIVILCCIPIGVHFLRSFYFRPSDWVAKDSNLITGKPWYSSEEVLNFRNSYPPPGYTIDTPSVTYMLQGCSVGFGSYVNNLFNLFLVALDNNVAFHVISLDWCYSSWPLFFEDYTSNSSAPIGLTGHYYGLHKWWNSPQWKHIDISSTSYQGHITVQHSDENFQELYQVQLGKIKEPVFERKQIVTQALWEPKALIKDVVVKTRELYVEKDKKVFISMHIRRGDKIRAEAKDLSISLYAEKVRNLVDNKYHGRHIALFVFSDEDKPIAMLRTLLADHSKIQIFTLIDAFNRQPQLAKTWKPIQQREGYDQKNFVESDKEYQFLQTAELITDITLAATADEFIGTYSSNIGRLLVLLRTHPTDTVHSMDWDKWELD